MAPGLDEFDVIIRSCIVFSQSISDPTCTPNKSCHEKICLMPTTKEEISLGICGV